MRTGPWGRRGGPMWFRYIRGKNEESHMETLRLYLPDAVETALFRIIYDTPCSPLARLLYLGGSSWDWPLVGFRTQWRGPAGWFCSSIIIYNNHYNQNRTVVIINSSRSFILSCSVSFDLSISCVVGDVPILSRLHGIRRAWTRRHKKSEKIFAFLIFIDTYHLFRCKVSMANQEGPM